MTTVDYCLVSNKFYTPPDCALITTDEPTEDIYLPLFTDLGVEFYEGYVDDYDIDVDDQKFICKMRSAWEIDFKQKVDKSYIGQTAPYIIKDIIDTYCQFLWYQAANIDPTSASTTLYTVRFQGCTILDVFKKLDNYETFQTSIRPDGEVYWDTYTSSGVTLTDASEFRIVPTCKPKRYKKSIVILEGAYNGTKRLEAKVTGEPNFGTYRARFPELSGTVDPVTGYVTSGPLYDRAVQILANKNIVVNIIHFSVKGGGYLKEGTTVHLDLPFLLVNKAACHGDFYIYASEYDGIGDVCEVYCSDIMKIETKYTDEIAEVKEDVNTVRQDQEQTLAGENTFKKITASDSGNYKCTLAGQLIQQSAAGTSLDGLGDYAKFGTPTVYETHDDSANGHNMVAEITADVADLEGVQYHLGDFTSISLEIWIKNSNASNYTMVYIVEDTADFHAIGGFSMGAGVINVISAHNSATATTVAFSANVWYHFRVEWTKGGVQRIYMNGTQIYYQSTATNITGHLIRLGNYGASTSYFDALTISSEAGYLAGMSCTSIRFDKGLYDSTRGLFIRQQPLTPVHVANISGFTEMQDAFYCAMSATTAKLSIVFYVENTGIYMLGVDAWQDSTTASVDVDGDIDVGIPITNRTSIQSNQSFNLLTVLNSGDSLAHIGGSFTLTGGRSYVITYEKTVNEVANGSLYLVGWRLYLL